MPRAALTAAVLGFLLAAGASAIDPHLDSSLLPVACLSCHQGHGVSRSPMLPSAQLEVCLACHDSQARVDRLIQERRLSPQATPQLLSAVRAKQHVHPLSAEAFSRREGEAVACTSCHAAHRSSPEDAGSLAPLGRPRLSHLNPNSFEYELCQRCHGSEGVSTQNLLDLSRLTNPNSRSYHPIEAPARESSPSVLSELGGQQVNCTDCHGNNDPDGPRGPHGSDFQYILRREYTTVDGSEESPSTYALCYGCHTRATVLAKPIHQSHVVEQRQSCASCHSAHGSVVNRALIRFGEETLLGSVGPSTSTGRLAFVSEGPGTGSCYLTCHGVDHGPLSYGGLEAALDSLDTLFLVDPVVIRGIPINLPERPRSRQRPRE